MRLKNHHSAHRLLVTLFFMMWLAASVSAQEATAKKYDRDFLKKTAREIMLNARYCSLITVNDSGQADARIMDPFPPEENFVVWLGTNPRTRKVKHISGNPRVTLFYFDREGLGYVSLAGKAELIDAPKEKAKRWKEGWEAFYPDREKDYLLIKVIPKRLEIVSVKHRISGDSLKWVPPSLTF